MNLPTSSVPELHLPSIEPGALHAGRERGYLLLSGALDAHAIDAVRAWTGEVLGWPEQSGRQWVYREHSRIDGASIVSRVECVAPFHPGFRALAQALAPLAGAMLGEPAVLFKEKIQCKFPGADGFTPHQDSQAGWDRYAPLFVTAMVSIDDCDASNGCIEMGVGQFERSLRQSWEPLREDQLAGIRFDHVPTRAGDVLLFDSLVPHRSEPNLSDRTRWVYYATYNAASQGDHWDAYHAHKHASYPPDIDRQAGREYVYRV